MPDDNDRPRDFDAENEPNGEIIPVDEMVRRLEAKKIAAEIEQMRSVTEKSSRGFWISIASLSVAAVAIAGPMLTEVYKRSHADPSTIGPAYAQFMVKLSQSYRLCNTNDKSTIEPVLQELERAYYALEPYYIDYYRKKIWSMYKEYLIFCESEVLGEERADLKVKERGQEYIASFRDLLLRRN